MEPKEPVWRKNLRAAVLDKFDGNMKAASKQAGLGETVVRDILERDRTPKVDTFIQLAQALGQTPGALLGANSGEGQVPVVGYVGAGAETHLFGTGQGPFDWEPMPTNGSPRTVAVKVRGDSMAGMFDDGATLFYDDVREPPTDDLIGRLCIIWLADGRVLVKKLYRSQKRGRWDLHSTNAGPMLEQQVKWAARVVSINL